jgi:hypothetical protein
MYKKTFDAGAAVFMERSVRAVFFTVNVPALIVEAPILVKILRESIHDTVCIRAFDIELAGEEMVLAKRAVWCIVLIVAIQDKPVSSRVFLKPAMEEAVLLFTASPRSIRVVIDRVMKRVSHQRGVHITKRRVVFVHAA